MLDSWGLGPQRNVGIGDVAALVAAEVNAVSRGMLTLMADRKHVGSDGSSSPHQALGVSSTEDSGAVRGGVRARSSRSGADGTGGGGSQAVAFDVARGVSGPGGDEDDDGRLIQVGEAPFRTAGAPVVMSPYAAAIGSLGGDGFPSALSFGMGGSDLDGAASPMAAPETPPLPALDDVRARVLTMRAALSDPSMWSTFLGVRGPEPCVRVSLCVCVCACVCVCVCVFLCECACV
jgi:hypothetical protein